MLGALPRVGHCTVLDGPLRSLEPITIGREWDFDFSSKSADSRRRQAFICAKRCKHFCACEPATSQATRLNQTSDSVSATPISDAATAANSDVISRLLRSMISLELRLW